jgi:hypothetical protein
MSKEIETGTKAEPTTNELELFLVKPSLNLGEKEFNFNSLNRKRNGKTIIDAMPTRDNVIVKITYKVKAPIVADQKKLMKSTPDTIEVVAYGCETEGLEINDRVLITYHSTIELLTIPGNQNTIELVQKRVAEAMKNPANSFAKLSQIDVRVESYHNTPYYSIAAILGKVEVKNELSVLDAMTGNV